MVGPERTFTSMSAHCSFHVAARVETFREEGALLRPNKIRRAPSHDSLFRGFASIPEHIFVLLVQLMRGAFSSD